MKRRESQTYLFLKILYCYYLHRTERNFCRSGYGGLLKCEPWLHIPSDSRAVPAQRPCHLYPGRAMVAPTASWKAVSAGEAVQGNDYSLVFTVRELGSIRITQQVKNSEAALFPYSIELNCDLVGIKGLDGFQNPLRNITEGKGSE